MAQNYNDTIHKMQTPFEMRAGLPKKEPKMLEDWEQNHVYEQMIKNNEGKPRYVLHDGPPYANGNIHMGTALNKIIKDIIRALQEHGWFPGPLCAGLRYPRPAHRAESPEVCWAIRSPALSKLELRKICKEFATEHIDVMNAPVQAPGRPGRFRQPLPDPARPSLRPARSRSSARWPRRATSTRA